MTRMKTKNSKRMMKNKTALYFLICSTIWGLTWIAIKFQIQAVDSTVAVFYRFIFATAVMFGLCYFNKTNLKYTVSDHVRFGLQGLFMFCLNFIVTYWASSMATSALVALAFTSLIFFNMFGARIFFKTPFENKVVWGAIISLLGMGFITLNEYQHIVSEPLSIWGFLLSLMATLAASCGNLISTQNRQLKIPILSNNAFSMLYGSTITFIYCLAMNKDFHVDTSTAFWISFIYLSIFGTVVSFWSYLKLIDEVGPSKAAFTSVVSPVIALVVSTFYEGFSWNLFMLLGVIFCIAGNLVALVKFRSLIKRFAV